MLRLSGAIKRGNRQKGSLSEFAIAVPILLGIGLATLQVSFIYHGKTTLNYATFEAARTGATHNARVDRMRHELGLRLAPLLGGDGSADKAAAAIVRSRLMVGDPLRTRIEIINPTLAAFDDWGVEELDSGRRIIPNSHLRHQGNEIGNASGLSIRDANILKIKVKYGFDLKVPLVGRALALAMRAIDPDNHYYYEQNQIPLTAVATVRMQSSAWKDEIEQAEASMAEAQVADDEAATGNTSPVADTSPLSDNSDSFNSLLEGAGGVENDFTDNGLPGDGADGVQSCPTTAYEESETGISLRAGVQWDCTTGVPPKWENRPEPQCEEADALEPEEAHAHDDERRSLLNRVVTAVVPAAVEFVQGFINGIWSQIEDVWELVTNPEETLAGLIELGKAFYHDFAGTVATLGSIINQNINQDVSDLEGCGPYDKGRIIGSYVSGGAVVKLTVKLGRYRDLTRAASETRAELARERNVPEEVICASSFAAGTRVWTPTGLKSIEDIEVGNQVLSRNEFHYFDSTEAVTHLYSRQAKRYLELQTERLLLRVTEEHPFWVQGKGWVSATELKAYDIVATATGDEVVLEKQVVDEPIDVYNFSVANNQSYFVGDAGVWVHNVNCFDVYERYLGNPDELENPHLLENQSGVYSDGTIGPGFFGYPSEPRDPNNKALQYQEEVTGIPIGMEYFIENDAGKKWFDDVNLLSRMVTEVKRYTSATLENDFLMDIEIDSLVQELRIARESGYRLDIVVHTEEAKMSLIRALEDDLNMDLQRYRQDMEIESHDFQDLGLDIRVVAENGKDQ